MGCCWGWFLVGCKTTKKTSTAHELSKGDTAVGITAPLAWPSCAVPTTIFWPWLRRAVGSNKSLATSSCSHSRAWHSPSCSPALAEEQAVQDVCLWLHTRCPAWGAVTHSASTAQPAAGAGLQLQPRALFWWGWSMARQLECSPAPL